MFKDKENNKEKKDKTLTSKVDKLIMGAIIGGAIGSVVGASMHPKVRKKAGELMEKHGLLKNKKRGIIKGIFSLIFRKKQNEESEMKRIPHETVDFTIEDEDRERTS